VPMIVGDVAAVGCADGCRIVAMAIADGMAFGQLRMDWRQHYLNNNELVNCKKNKLINLPIEIVGICCPFGR
jgi:hypothetical protein